MKRFIILMLGIAPAVSAQTAPNLNLERIANDAYSRSHDYHLVHQRIVVKDFDWDSTSFNGSVASTLVSLRPGLDSVILDAGELLNIHRVVNSVGTTLRTSRHGDTLVVLLPKAVALRDTVRFTIDYHAKIVSGQGLTFIGERAHTPRQIWSQGEDHDNHYWFPTYDFPNDKMTWEVEATVPAGFTAVSNGALVSETRGEPRTETRGESASAAGERTFIWRQEKPSATYLVSLVVAPLAKIHDSWHGVPVDYYTYRQDSALAWPLFHVTPDMIDTYSRLTGVPYPWAKYAQTTVADFFGGMENVSATTLVDWLPDARAYLDRPWYQRLLIPHELAHQWFGDYATLENWANMWLNEGFAEFMPGQYWLHKQGAHSEQDYYVDEYRQFMAIDARRRMPLASLGSNNIYPKGALVLEMLERYLGEERFWAGIHEYLTRHALGNATTDDLRQDIFRATGENLDWFWSEWVYAAGYPEFDVHADYDSSAQRLTLVVTQQQRDTLKADNTGMRYVTPEAFRMPITIRVGTAAGDIVALGAVGHRVDTLVASNVRSAPTMVVFDDGNTILKKLTFDQPTPWLATQLARDENLWNREWVIQQLMERRKDDVAAAAVATAATSADYFLTRAQAAAALPAFGADAALPALERALADTSAQVRQAAAAALGGLDGGAPAHKAVELAVDRWRRDSSYEVRAAALTAALRLDALSATAKDSLVAEALATPSYRSAIQNAAFTYIAQTQDVAFVDQVQQLVGEQDLPAFVLASLVRHGNQHARDLLAADLNDPRAWVRQYALAAITRAMEPDRALSILHGAEGTLTHPDTKAAVAQALGLLQRARK